jgi:hypothetical protein
MPPSDDLFYARLPTLSNAELFNYIHHYSDYKVEAVQAALAEVHTRGLYVSEAVLSDIERYCTRQEQQRMRPFNCDPRHLRWLAYAMVIIGLGSAVFLYATASPPPQPPLGYDPFASKKYVRELEVYGGKINVLAVEFRQWCASLWRGKLLAYTIALLTVLLASLLWRMGSLAAAHRDTQAEQHDAPSDAWS